MKTEPTVLRSALVVAALTVVAAGLLKIIGRPMSVSSGSGAPYITPTSPYPDPIFAEATAVSRTQATLAASSPVSLTAVTTRLITLGSFESWSGVSDDRPDTLPVWLVGFQADDLTVGDVMPYSGSTDPILGGFFLWDATGGDAIAQGALYDSDSRTYASIDRCTSNRSQLNQDRHRHAQL